MKYELKKYKFSKIQHYFKTTKIFFFFHGTNLNIKNWTKIEQDLIQFKLKYYRLYNTLTINVLKNSIFRNITVLINGSIFLISLKNETNLIVHNILNINPSLFWLSIRINNKIYSIYQIKSMTSLNFYKNITTLHKSLQILLKTPYYKFQNK